jgi:molecular chaperone HscC
VIVGIDLGTTNSLIGFWHNGQAELIPNALGELLTPSAVSVGDDGHVLVGSAARERLATHPLRTATAFKRYMGSEREMTLGSHAFRPEELSALVLRALKADAEAYIGETIADAVITVPAYFNDVQRKATKAAGELAGLNVRRLLTEPTAAALAYGPDRPADDELLLVVDLGGGTFDVSLLHVFEGVTEVRATAGDSRLGGEDFVDRIVAAFMDEAGTRAGLPPAGSASVVQASLRRQAELAKCRLSMDERTVMRVVNGERTVEWELTRETFEVISEPLLARLRFPIGRALRDARMEPDRITRVILAGGASRMPMFRKLVSRLFRRLPQHGIDPEEVVARGAAIRAGMLARDTDLVERVMTDVAPFTLGIGVSDVANDTRIANVFLPIVERNTVIPASRLKRVVNVADNQLEVILRVYQGESHFVDDNIELGKLAVPIPPGPAGSQAIDVRFTYDPSGLLEVESLVVSTGARRTLVIEGNPGVLSSAEIAARLSTLEQLKVHPRDQAEFQALLARGKRLYEEHLGAVRAEIGRAVTGFAGALESQDPDNIRLAAKSLDALVARLDDRPFS